ncbi:MFS transporter [bacterium]|nr:MFS transporter [bacterium]
MQQQPRFHPSTRLFRFTLLIFISLLSFGTYFAYDIISAVAPSLVEEYTPYTITGVTIDSLRHEGLPEELITGLVPLQNRKMTKTELLNALNSFESEPSKPVQEADADELHAGMKRSILRHAGGAGARSTVGSMFSMYSIAAILSVFIGGILIDRLGTRFASMTFSILVLLGAMGVAAAQSLPLLLAGRFVFGAGSEPLIVAQSAIIARWFKNKEMALAYGLALTVSRLGTLFSFNTGELIASHFGSYKYSLAAAVIFCGISLLANVVYIFMDRHGEKALELHDESEEKIVLKDIRQFKPSFWFVTLLCTTFYSAIFPFTALSTDFFVDKWGIQRVAAASGGFFHQVFNNFLHMFSTAGGISSIIIFASMIFAPLAGHLVDKVGRRATVMIYGSIILIPSHLLLGLTHIHPAISMIFLGIAFVLVPAALWPSVPMVVAKHQVGTAFGLLTMVQNIGLALFPLLNGLLRDLTHSYTASMIMFASLGVFGLVFAVLLKKADSGMQHILEKP